MNTKLIIFCLLALALKTVSADGLQNQDESEITNSEVVTVINNPNYSQVLKTIHQQDDRQIIDIPSTTAFDLKKAMRKLDKTLIRSYRCASDSDFVCIAELQSMMLPYGSLGADDGGMSILRLYINDTDIQAYSVAVSRMLIYANSIEDGKQLGQTEMLDHIIDVHQQCVNCHQGYRLP